MRVAVISDIHGNEEALQAVLHDVEAESPDAIWCLGDVVGYGPAPNECCAVARERTQVCLVGNHDAVVLGDLDIADFNGDAAAAAQWTREQLTDDSRAFLAALDPSAVAAPGIELYHASPRDPFWEYVLSTEVGFAGLRSTDADLVFVGHSHVALALGIRGDEHAGGLAPDGTRIELDGRWLLNPGSVGQPRDGDPRAAWLLLDTDAAFADFRRVAYPVERTQAAMRAAGLPDALAERLSHGV